ncbi:MAG: M56 family metallopeptidase [Bacteroidales bacterium]|nr:M56 family metallopeptidase [Bacteroidales bacterium]
MTDLLTYLLHSSAILAALVTVYWLFLRKETFFHVNRFYLVFSVLLSLTMPFIRIGFFETETFRPAAILLEPVLITGEKVDKIAGSNISAFQLVAIVYFTGVVIFTAKFIFQLIQLAVITRRFKIIRRDGSRFVLVDNGYSPFSFFNFIYIREEYLTDDKFAPVVAHEKVHIRQIHTVDIILAEFAVILQWFNPFAWLAGHAIKRTHEFLADEGVLKDGFQKQKYQEFILQESIGIQLNTLTNNFNVSLLKNRIIMMTKKRSASWAKLKAGFALPSLAVVLFLFTAGNPLWLTAQESQQKSEQAKAVQTVSQSAQEEPAFQVVKNMPSFKGGMDAMTKYLVENIKYPPEAKTKGTAGTVFVTYVIEKDGSVTNVKILQGIGDGCDEEAARVVKGMPKWNPGTNDNNEPVRVIFNLPIKFSLEGKKEEVK